MSFTPLVIYSLYRRCIYKDSLNILKYVCRYEYELYTQLKWIKWMSSRYITSSSVPRHNRNDSLNQRPAPSESKTIIINLWMDTVGCYILFKIKISEHVHFYLYMLESVNYRTFETVAFSDNLQSRFSGDRYNLVLWLSTHDFTNETILYTDLMLVLVNHYTISLKIGVVTLFSATWQMIPCFFVCHLALLIVYG